MLLTEKKKHATIKKREEFQMLVQISAHPADRYLYLDALKEALADIPDLTVCLTEEPKDGKSDLQEGVEVLVLLASEKYFTWQNSGYESEYIIAKSKGIRVIPLMLEGHIMNLLNMRCSKTQYIHAAESFSFALSELAATLQAPRFQAVDPTLPSVFISYRKGDKPYLKKLLSLLDQAPNRQAFTVWYDEIISPGDNYSHAIQKALDESDLFLLLVTPAILEKTSDNSGEKKNYVMRNEYPTAIKQGKKIVAIEAVKTDRQALAASFPGLSKLISLKQSGALYATLSKIWDKW